MPIKKPITVKMSQLTPSVENGTPIWELPPHTQLLQTYKTKTPARAPDGGFEVVEGVGTRKLVLLCTAADSEVCDRAVSAANPGAELVNVRSYQDMGGPFSEE